MAKRVIGIVIAALLIYGCFIAYMKWKNNRDQANGEIYSSDPTPPSRTRSGEASPGVPTKGTGSVASALPSMPASDSFPANAPNDTKFTGTGKFQVYRQGNLTWRVNTETGESCVLFATEDEWRKPIVYNHGCNAS